jgi:hypothetical protein
MLDNYSQLLDSSNGDEISINSESESESESESGDESIKKNLDFCLENILFPLEGCCTDSNQEKEYSLWLKNRFSNDTNIYSLEEIICKTKIIQRFYKKFIKK